jgi:hypothetical protein
VGLPGDGGQAVTDPRTTEYNQQGDVWQHSYAYHNRQLPTPQRSPDHFDICDRLWYAAQVNEAGDRKLAQLLRDAAARIRALEDILKTTLRSKCSTEGGCT